MFGDTDIADLYAMKVARDRDANLAARIDALEALREPDLRVGLPGSSTRR
jgi:hypothetical protein